MISDNLECLRQSTTKKGDYVRNVKKHPEIYKPFFIIVFLSLVQQFSGVSVIRAYVVKIFDEVFSNHSLGHQLNSTLNVTTVFLGTDGCLVSSRQHKTSSMAYVAAMVIGVCRLISSLALARLLRSVSRRVMYFISLSLTLLCLTTFATFSHLVQSLPKEGSSRLESVFQWGSLVAVCLLVFSVQLGVQTLPLILSGELF